TRTVNVVDTQPPTLTLNGSASMTVECHSTFTDPGATANDACAGDLTGAIQVGGTVNGDAVETYTLTYTVSDGQGHTASATRTVNVTDTLPPTLTLNSSASMPIECHDSFTDPGATADDACAGDLTSSISVTGAVNSNAVGTYTLTYSAADGHGHTASAMRTVNVVDTQPPTLTLNGAASITIECHAGFVDPGATANDICAGNLTSAIQVSGTVNANAVGTYTLTYSVTDGFNPVSTTRTVHVVDTTAPSLTLNGLAEMSIECHGGFVDPGAAASDLCAGDLTGAIQVSGSVDANTVNSYVLTYTVTDGF